MKTKTDDNLTDLVTGMISTYQKEQQEPGGVFEIILKYWSNKLKHCPLLAMAYCKSVSFKKVVLSSIKKGLYACLPYITFGFMREYFDTLDSIANSQRRLATRGPYMGGISQDHLQYRLMMTCHWINLAHFVGLSILPHGSRYVQLLLNDFCTLCGLPHVFTVYYCPILICILCLYHQFYCWIQPQYCTTVIRRVLIDNERSFVLNSKRPIAKWVMWNLWLYQGFTAFLDIYIIAYHVIITIEMINLLGPNLWSLMGGLSLVLMNLTAFMTYLSLVAFAYIGYLGCTFIVAGSAISFVRLDAIARLLHPVRRNEPNWWTLHRMLRFRKLHCETMRYHFSLDKVYGKFLLAFIGFTVPNNSGIVMASFMGTFSPFHAVFYPVYALGQFTVILAFHLNATKFVHKIQGPIKQLMALNIQNLSGSIQNRLKIANYIETFHTKKPYGIRYAGYGLVTMATFIKCILLYSEILMYNYRILRHPY